MNELAAITAWLESQCGLHQRVEVHYVVDGYEVDVIDGFEQVLVTFKGVTVLEALQLAIKKE